MDHAITLGGLLLFLAVIGGLVAAVFGTLMMFAGGMSDAGDDGTSGKGCVIAIIGAIIFGAALFGLLT